MTTKSNRIATLVLACAFAATALGLPVMAQSNASNHPPAAPVVVEQSPKIANRPHMVKNDENHASHDLEREEDRFHVAATDHNGKKREISFDGEGK